MRDRFVPPSYHRDLHKKLMCLEQGEKFVQDYYGELQNGLMRCGVVEGPEDSICRFYSGLRREIQDIVDYKECNTATSCFSLLCLQRRNCRDVSSKARASPPPLTRNVQ